MIRYLAHITLVFLAVQCLSNQANSQDIHFSQFFNVPGNYNPGDAGRFDGDYRIGTVYRSQWRTVTVPFTTFGISADANKLFPKKPIGTGIAIFRDQAGDGNFTTTQVNLSGSYKLPFLSDSTQSISLGLQVGITHKSIDFEAFEWGSQFDGVVYNPNLGTNEFFQNDKNTVFDFHLGAQHKKAFSDKLALTSGVSFFNISFQNQSFSEEKVPLFTRTNIQAIADYQYNEKLKILPAMNVSLQGKFREWNIGGAVRYNLTESQGVRQEAGAGLFYRSGDAGYVYFDFIYDKWKTGISYDFNFSDLKVASNGRGGLELTLVYVFKKFRPRIVGGRVCPDFI